MFLRVIQEKQLSENDVVFSNLEILQMCDDEETFMLIRKYLITEGKATAVSSAELQGLKIRTGIQPMGVSKADKEILHLKCTLQTLQNRAVKLSEQIKGKKEEAAKSARNGDKRLALWWLKQARLLDSAMVATLSVSEKLQATLEMIFDAELAAKVTEAVKTGLVAVRRTTVSFEEAQKCVEDIEEAMAEQRRLQNTLGGERTMDALEEAELGEELAVLEKSMAEHTDRRGVVFEKHVTGNLEGLSHKHVAGIENIEKVLKTMAIKE